MANLPTTMEYFDNLLGEQLTEGGGGSSDFSTGTLKIAKGEGIGNDFWVSSLTQFDGAVGQTSIHFADNEEIVVNIPLNANDEMAIGVAPIVITAYTTTKSTSGKTYTVNGENCTPQVLGTKSNMMGTSIVISIGLENSHAISGDAVVTISFA